MGAIACPTDGTRSLSTIPLETAELICRDEALTKANGECHRSLRGAPRVGFSLQQPGRSLLDLFDAIGAAGHRNSPPGEPGLCSAFQVLPDTISSKAARTSFLDRFSLCLLLS